MITRGNTKLGPAFWSFSIPAVATCPGATALCRASCYAQNGRFLLPSVRDAAGRNLKATRRKDFPRVMAGLIRDNCVELLRGHVSGDFYDESYLDKWTRIASGCRSTVFLFYTRSWRVPGLGPALAAFGALPNVRLWLSADADSGEPPPAPWAWGVAYMSLADADAPPYPVDLVFRDRPKTPMKFTAAGDLVCPYEQATGRRLTCSRCRYCTSPRAVTRRTPGRVPLAVVN